MYWESTIKILALYHWNWVISIENCEASHFFGAPEKATFWGVFHIHSIHKKGSCDIIFWPKLVGIFFPVILDDVPWISYNIYACTIGILF